MNKVLQQIIFIALLIVCATPLISPPMALLLGILVAQFIGHPYLHLNGKTTKWLLQISVVGLGFGMNAQVALQASKEGFWLTVITIIGTLVFGFLFGKLFKVETKTSYLISTGTAICGGSAIAAVAPVIKANENQISIALGTVFILNSVALFIFPWIGSWLSLSQSDFGLWSAIAIHDTSSVVGAAGKYGDEALQIATTVKLTRALWIIPLAFFSIFAFKSQGQKVKIPYFIGFFVLAIILNTYIPRIQSMGPSIFKLSKTGMTLTLFLIGSGFSRKSIASVGFKLILQGIVLWVVISVSTLLVVLWG